MRVMIRKFGPQDFRKLNGFFCEISSDPSSDKFHPHPFSEDYAKKISQYNSKDWFVGAFDDEDALIGYAFLRGWDEGFDIPSFGVYVLPKFRKKGVGRSLVTSALKEGQKRGCPYILLRLHPENQPAICLYESVGFKFDGKYRYKIESCDNQITGYFEYS